MAESEQTPDWPPGGWEPVEVGLVGQVGRSEEPAAK